MKSFTIVAGLLVLAPMTGCKTRDALNQAMVQDARSKGALEDLRVYVDRTTVPTHTKQVPDSSGVYRLDRKITTRAGGMIVHEDERDGAPRIWISFSTKCRSQECAYGFVLDGDGYRLSDLPQPDDYDTSAVYQRRREVARSDNGTYPVVLEVEQSG